MRTITLLTTLAFLFVGIAAVSAQTDAAPAAADQTETAATAPEALTPEQIQTAIDITKQHIESRELRIKNVTEDLQRLNDRVEGQIDRILGMITPITDSEQSRKRVAQDKQSVIDALKNSIGDYDKLRQGLQAETRERDPRIDRKEIYEDIETLNEKVNTRVEQIIKLANSMDTWKDYNKYNVSGSGSSSWRGGGYYRTKNPKYYHNRSAATRSGQERDQLIQDLKDSLERLDREHRDIQTKLDNKNITPQYREMLEYERDRNLGLSEERQMQIDELATASQAPTKAVGRNQALTIEGHIKDVAEDLRGDYDSMFRTYHELNQERQALKVLQERLEKYQGMANKAGA